MSGARLSRDVRGLDHIFYIPNGSSHQQFVHELSVMNQRTARHPLGPLSSQSDDTRSAQPPQVASLYLPTPAAVPCRMVSIGRHPLRFTTAVLPEGTCKY
jgi:hypothetical protein